MPKWDLYQTNLVVTIAKSGAIIRNVSYSVKHIKGYATAKQNIIKYVVDMIDRPLFCYLPYSNWYLTDILINLPNFFVENKDIRPSHDVLVEILHIVLLKSDI